MRTPSVILAALAFAGSLGFAACSDEDSSTAATTSSSGSTSSGMSGGTGGTGGATSGAGGAGGMGGMTSGTGGMGGAAQGGGGAGGMGGMTSGTGGMGGVAQGGGGAGGMGGMTSGTGGMGGAGGGATVADCFSCSSANCINEINACQFDATCQPWLQCVQLCTDSACTDMCDMQYPNAKPQYDPIYTCNCNNCPLDCAMFDPCPNMQSNWQVCQSCTAAHCPNSVTACQNDALCAQWLGCMQSCNDEPCSMQCDMQYPNAKALYDGLYTCNCAACPADCTDFNACGKITSSPLDCSTCAQMNCLQPLTACQSDALCSQWLTCVQACNDAACADMCDMQYPNAKALYDPVYACSCAQCPVDCAVYNVCNL